MLQLGSQHCSISVVTGADGCETGAFKVSQIAEQVGFTTKVLLGRAFQKQFGMSPSAYAPMRHAAPI